VLLRPASCCIATGPVLTGEAQSCGRLTGDRPRPNDPASAAACAAACAAAGLLLGCCWAVVVGLLGWCCCFCCWCFCWVWLPGSSAPAAPLCLTACCLLRAAALPIPPAIPLLVILFPFRHLLSTPILAPDAHCPLPTACPLPLREQGAARGEQAWRRCWLPGRWLAWSRWLPPVWAWLHHVKDSRPGAAGQLCTCAGLPGGVASSRLLRI
jgi:hypothetical protein